MMKPSENLRVWVAWPAWPEIGPPGPLELNCGKEVVWPRLAGGSVLPVGAEMACIVWDGEGAASLATYSRPSPDCLLLRALDHLARSCPPRPASACRPPAASPARLAFARSPPVPSPTRVAGQQRPPVLASSSLSTGRRKPAVQPTCNLRRQPPPARLV
ncbi:hypothetical protein ACLOJK_032346 [Asimina triloba]